MAAVEHGVSRALKGVLERIAAAASRASRSAPVRLVAVSKTKPVELLKEAYDAGQRVFGENYAQELVDKAPQMPGDVEWHFIGHLQSNKVNMVLKGCPALAMLETVDTVKLANKLNNAVETIGRPQLSIMIQVNTSGEESKYGVEPDGAVELAQHIRSECPHLHLAGLMTIGQPDYSSRPENFVCLMQCREQVAKALDVDPSSLELSMGMSADYEQAIEMGSTNVRIGSTIFGARDYSNK